MDYKDIKKDLLKPKSWLTILTLKSLSFILFLSHWGFTSGQTAITFKASSGAYYSAGSTDFPEMTVMSLNPVAGSAIYWEFFETGVWRRYGGTGYLEYATHIGQYRAWYKHGILGTYAVTNTLTVINLKTKLTPSFETELSGDESQVASGLKIIGSIFESELFPNPFQQNLNIVCEADKSYSLMVYNEIGQLIFKLGGLTGKTILETDDWKKGMYLIQIIENNSKNSYSRKAIKI
jgi:hypothetical protein